MIYTIRAEIFATCVLDNLVDLHSVVVINIFGMSTAHITYPKLLVRTAVIGPLALAYSFIYHTYIFGISLKRIELITEPYLITIS